MVIFSVILIFLFVLQSEAKKQAEVQIIKEVSNQNID